MWPTPPLIEAEHVDQPNDYTTKARVEYRRKAFAAWMPQLSGHTLLGGDYATIHRRSFLFRSIGILAPLRPASHKDFDFGVTGKFQGKSLDRGSSTRLSVTHRRFVGQDSPLPEKLLQLRLRFEAPVFGDEFFPFQMRRARNTASSKFAVAPSINQSELV